MLTNEQKQQIQEYRKALQQARSLPTALERREAYEKATALREKLEGIDPNDYQMYVLTN